MHQLSHNMTTDCSWNYHENYTRRTWAEIDAKIRASDKDLPVLKIWAILQKYHTFEAVSCFNGQNKYKIRVSAHFRVCTTKEII